MDRTSPFRYPTFVAQAVGDVDPPAMAVQHEDDPNTYRHPNFVAEAVGGGTQQNATNHLHAGSPHDSGRGDHDHHGQAKVIAATTPATHHDHRDGHHPASETAHQAKGQIKETAGRVTGNPTLQASGAVEKDLAKERRVLAAPTTVPSVTAASPTAIPILAMAPTSALAPEAAAKILGAGLQHRAPLGPAEETTPPPHRSLGEIVHQVKGTLKEGAGKILCKPQLVAEGAEKSSRLNKPYQSFFHGRSHTISNFWPWSWSRPQQSSSPALNQNRS